MVKINPVTKGKGGTVGLSEDLLESSKMAVGDKVDRIPGEKQIIIKKREERL